MTKQEIYKNRQRKLDRIQKAIDKIHKLAAEKFKAFKKLQDIEFEKLLALGPKDFSPGPYEKEMLGELKKEKEKKKLEQLVNLKPNRALRRKLMKGKH